MGTQTTHIHMHTMPSQYNAVIFTPRRRALSNMLTAGAIAPAVEQIASPVTGICPRSENLKFYVIYVPCKLLTWIKTIGLENGIVFPFFAFPFLFALTQSKSLRWGPVAKSAIIFFWAAKEDFRFEKHFFVLQIYSMLLHGNNKLFKISERNPPPPPRNKLCKCSSPVTRLAPAVEIP